MVIILEITQFIKLLIVEGCVPPMGESKEIDMIKIHFINV